MSTQNELVVIPTDLLMSSLEALFERFLNKEMVSQPSTTGPKKALV